MSLCIREAFFIRSWQEKALGDRQPHGQQEIPSRIVLPLMSSLLLVVSIRASRTRTDFGPQSMASNARAGRKTTLSAQPESCQTLVCPVMEPRCSRRWRRLSAISGVRLHSTHKTPYAHRFKQTITLSLCSEVCQPADIVGSIIPNLHTDCLRRQQILLSSCFT